MVQHGNVMTWLPFEEMESGVWQQVEAVSRLPFIFRNVGVMPDAHVGRGACVGTVVATEGAVAPSIVGVDIGCFVGETKVPLLDGTQKMLREMAETGEEYWVYSIDPETLTVVPSRAIGLHTREDALLLKVTLAGGEEILCTPDHQFMLKDGTYREAENLKFNDSLMPLYRQWQSRDGYESVSSGRGTKSLTHRLVYESIHGWIADDVVIHHVNHNHFDNRPENLQSMSPNEHSSYHRYNGHSFQNEDGAFQSARHAGIARRSADPEKRAEMVRVGTENITAYMNERPDHFQSAVSGNGKRGAPYLRSFNTSPRSCDDCGQECKNPTALSWHKKRDCPAGIQVNHKVMKVEALEERSDVYCLQVEKYHNFALAAGVFVHNCGVYYMPSEIKHVQLPSDLSALRENIERRIYLGHGPGYDKITHTADRWVAILEQAAGDRLVVYDEILPHWRMQVGSLGSGNHFIELVVNDEGFVGGFLHSGSRGIGNKLATRHIQLAKYLNKEQRIELPDPDLAYFLEGTEEFDDYIRDVNWCQLWAQCSREEMMGRLMMAVIEEAGMQWGWNRAPFIHHHHNFTQQERHFGTDVWITRKGAVSANVGELGLLPTAMSRNSYIVQGLGNPDSFCTAPHGAGRQLSRTAAKKTLNYDDLVQQMQGVEWKPNIGVLDEAPQAYKEPNVVLENSKTLIHPISELRPILNVKGQ